MNALLIIVLLPVLCSGATLSHIELESRPGTIHPVLTKKLQLRCAVKNSDYRAKPTASPSPTTAASSLWSDTIGLVEPDPTTSLRSSGSADFDRLLSLVVTKINNQTGQNETVASVTGCDSPVIEKRFEGTLSVEGNTEGSTVDGEQGYIALIWERPVEDQGGDYGCEAYALNTEKHSVSLVVTMHVAAVEPKIPDLVYYITMNEKFISDLRVKVSSVYEENVHLKQQLENLASENEEIKSKVNNGTVSNIEFGTTSCSYQIIYFNTTFTNPPTIVTSPMYMYYTNLNNNYFSYSLSTYNVGTTNFTLSCNLDGGWYSYANSATIQWLAIELS